LVRGWQERKLPGPEFTHAAHLAACAWLTFDFRRDKLVRVMKRGLILFNIAVGTPNSVDRGYHETLNAVLVRSSGKSGSGARAVVAMHGFGVRPLL
jgi:hypothetical protein